MRMGKLVIPALAVALAAPALVAQATSVAQGTDIQIKLDDSLSTRKNHKGDHFTATVIQAAQGSNGSAVIPAGSKIDGTVTNVQNGGTTGKSQLNLSFDRVTLPNGQSGYLHANLVSLNPQEKGTTGAIAGTVEGKPSTGNEGGVQQSNKRTTEGEAAAGGGIGAIVGAIAGGTKGAIIGGILGAGGGAVLSAKTHNLSLPSGTTMTIRLTQALTIQ